MSMMTRRKIMDCHGTATASRDRWLVSWADFMTLLFALFVVLWAASRHHEETYRHLVDAIRAGFHASPVRSIPVPAPPAPPPPQFSLPIAAPSPLAGVADELRAVLGSSIEHHEVALIERGDGLVVSFREPGFFRSGEAGLVHGQASKVVAAGKLLAAHGLSLRIEGYSDNQPIHNTVFSSNWELSTARAMAVLLLLVDQAHYDPRLLSLAGFGPYRPVADNATSQGRQENRRVDLVILRPPSP